MKEFALTQRKSILLLALCSAGRIGSWKLVAEGFVEVSRLPLRPSCSFHGRPAIGLLHDSRLQPPRLRYPTIGKASPSSAALGTTTSSSPIVGYAYMALLALQFAFQPIITKKFAPKNIVRTTYVLAQECVRLVIGTCLLLATKSWGKAVHGWTGLAALAAVGFPSILYLLQNYCSLMAYQHLPPITYNVLNQTKTLSAAIFCYFLLGQMQSPLQMLALLILLLSALVMESIIPLPWSKTPVAVPANQSTITPATQSLHDDTTREYVLKGIVPIIAASSISGLAGAYVQKSLSTRNSLLFSVELAALSIAILLVRLFLNQIVVSKTYTSPNGTNVHWASGWTWQTWIPVWTNASGGILVGLVTKHAGAVRKGFALIIGMFLSGILQNVGSSEKRVSVHQWVGGVLAGISLWLHSSYPLRQQ